MSNDKPGEGPSTTHFGFEQVPVGDKQKRVASSVAHRYVGMIAPRRHA